MFMFKKIVFLIETLVGIGGIILFLFGLMAGLMDIKYFAMCGMFLLPAIPMIILGFIGFKELINKPLPRIVSFLFILSLLFSLWAVLPYPQKYDYPKSDFLVDLEGFFVFFTDTRLIPLSFAIILFLFMHLLIIAFDRYFNSALKPTVIVLSMKTVSILSLVIIVISLAWSIIVKPNPTIKPDTLKNINLEVLDFVRENYHKTEYSDNWKNPSEETKRRFYEPLDFTTYKGYLGGERLIFRDKRREGAKIDVNIGIFDSDKRAIENFKYFHWYYRKKGIVKPITEDECWFKREAWWTDLYVRRNNVIIKISYPEIANSIDDIPENLKTLTAKLLSDILQ